MRKQLSLFDDQRLDLAGAMDLSLASLNAYGRDYRHWACAYSGGKDSSATVTFLAWALRTRQVRWPESLTVLYGNTRLELQPLYDGALALLETLDQVPGVKTKVVLPEMDKRFFVYMLGRGVPPPSNTFRWCTPMLKIEPMMNELHALRDSTGEKLLMITGVRLGESAARDQRIALSCSKDSGECGQGWFQVATPSAVADTLAPLLHWRICHVYDWLYFDPHGHGYKVDGVAKVYGEDDVRTGCIGCNLASKDTALLRVIARGSTHLTPLLELKQLYRELKRPQWRKRKARPERRQDGLWAKNVQRMGPLTMEGRKYGLDRVLDIQWRAGVNLINAPEEARIRELWDLDTWPDKWSADDVEATQPIDAMSLAGNDIVVQGLLV